MSYFGWHFTVSDRLANGDRRRIVPGEWLMVDPPIQLCRRGLHMSQRALDALRFAPGSMVWRVEGAGFSKRALGKVAFERRRALWGMDAAPVIRRFTRYMLLELLDGLDRHNRNRAYYPPGWAGVPAVVPMGLRCMLATGLTLDTADEHMNTNPAVSWLMAAQQNCYAVGLLGHACALVIRDRMQPTVLDQIRPEPIGTFLSAWAAAERLPWAPLAQFYTELERMLEAAHAGTLDLEAPID